MALIKEIELENGVKLNYHRICTINKITNNCTIIEVNSYTSKEKREIEKDAIEQGTLFNVLIEANYINMDYNENNTIKDCYEYLKTIDRYKDAIDD